MIKVTTIIQDHDFQKGKNEVVSKKVKEYESTGDKKLCSI